MSLHLDFLMSEVLHGIPILEMYRDTLPLKTVLNPILLVPIL